jgi:hypothetical protein
VLQRQRARSPGQNPDRSRRRAPPPCPRRTAAAGIPTALPFSDSAPPPRPYPLPVVLVEGKFASSPRKVASNSLLSAQRSAAPRRPPMPLRLEPPSCRPRAHIGHRRARLLLELPATARSLGNASRRAADLFASAFARAATSGHLPAPYPPLLAPHRRRSHHRPLRRLSRRLVRPSAGVPRPPRCAVVDSNL